MNMTEEVRRTSGTDQHLSPKGFLGRRQQAKRSLVLRRGDVSHLLSTSRADEEEQVEGGRALLSGERDQFRDLHVVLACGSGMDLHGETVTAARLYCSQRLAPRSRNATEFIVLSGIERIQAETNSLQPTFGQIPSTLITEQHAIGP
jgi:hypothetical protein